MSVLDVRTANFPVFSGSDVVSFAVSQMPPNTRIYTYVNNISITALTAPISQTALIGDPIFTDQLGNAVGALYIPSTNGTYKFPVGEIRLTFTDSPNGVSKSKYISETSIYNHGLTLVDTEQGSTISLRTTEKFRTDVSGNSNDPNTTQNRLDPLSQTFFVDEAANPLGITLLGVALFFEAKDDKLPIGIELRPMSGDKPSITEYISGSYVSKNPQDVGVYNTTTKNAPATVFQFQHPIYLKPGEYAFSVITKSAKYKLFSSKMGKGKNVKQPFAGRLFKAQNAGDWSSDLTEDLTFVLVKAKFETGTVTFEMESPRIIPTNYNKLRLVTTDIGFGTTAYADYKIQTTEAGTNRKSDLLPILQNAEPNLSSRQIANNAGDVKIEISLTTKSEDVAPILDQQLMKLQLFTNNVLPYTQQISASEQNPYHGFAKSRYISKIVSLAEGFDSTGIEISLDVNRKVGSDIEVFCRVLSRDDKSFSNGIRDRRFVKVPLVSPITKSYAGSSELEFTNETYRLLYPSLTYSNTVNLGSGNETPSTYDTFAYYQIKIVFYASNPVYLPKIKNLVAMSLLGPEI